VHPQTFYANCPIDVASQTTSVEFGMDKFVLPMLKVIAVSKRFRCFSNGYFTEGRRININFSALRLEPITARSIKII
jgi:hypothetical protein